MKHKSKFSFWFGRKAIFSVVLFVLVFAAASIVRIQAAGNVTGWLWGGSEDKYIGGNQTDCFSPPCVDGNETGIGWVSTNRFNCDSDGNGVTDNVNFPNCPVGQNVTTSDQYGLTIPESGDLSGYAWNENIGWISFNFGDAVNCPSGTCSAYRSGDNIMGWARIVEIKNALISSNSGGWEGWISLNGPEAGRKGVHIKSDGSLEGFGWSASSNGNAELGWIDFSRAKIPATPPVSLNPECSTHLPICPGSSLTCNPSTDCRNSTSCTPTGSLTYDCKNGIGPDAHCTVDTLPIDVGECGTANGGSFCQEITDSQLCKSGIPSKDGEEVTAAELKADALDKYEVTWRCGGTNSCQGSYGVDCSAAGLKSCGWIETNP